MKICVSGKGGVGKTLVSAALARLLAKKGLSVWAIDADPDANLALALGIDDADITPLAQMRQLIKERTGAQDGWGAIFRMNPEVADIPEKFYKEKDGVRLLVLGAVRKGGGGCACPENVFLRALLNHMVLSRNDAVVVDLEAGLEPLGRATVMGVNWMLVVTEPTEAALATVARIKRLADDLRIKRVGCIVNKVHNEEDVRFAEAKKPTGVELLGSVPYIEELRRRYGVVERLENAVGGVADKLWGIKEC